MSSQINQADKAITANPDARRCDKNTEHGKMFPHVSGAMLICGKCGFQAPMVSGQ